MKLLKANVIMRERERERERKIEGKRERDKERERKSEREREREREKKWKRVREKATFLYITSFVDTSDRDIILKQKTLEYQWHLNQKTKTKYH